MLDLPGSIEIGRNSNKEFTIRIRDERSQLIVCEVMLTAEQFALAINSRTEDCRLLYYGSPHIGKYHQHKTELVPITKWSYGEDFAALLAEAAKPFEVDGWEHDPEGNRNSHQEKDGKYRTIFRRYTEEAPDAS